MSKSWNGKIWFVGIVGFVAYIILESVIGLVLGLLCSIAFIAAIINLIAMYIRAVPLLFLRGVNVFFASYGALWLMSKFTKGDGKNSAIIAGVGLIALSIFLFGFEFSQGISDWTTTLVTVLSRIAGGVFLISMREMLEKESAV